MYSAMRTHPCRQPSYTKKKKKKKKKKKSACSAPSLRRYQFILLGEQRHMCVNNLPRVVTWSGTAGIGICDRSIASPTP